MSYLVKFGDYTLPAGLVPMDEPDAFETGSQARVRGSGSIARAARRQAVIRTFSGPVCAQTPDATEGILRALRSALYNRREKLWAGRDDCYFRDAQCISCTPGWGADGRLYGLYGGVTVRFEMAQYPERFELTEVTADLDTDGGTIAVGGDYNAPTLPIWSITIGTAGAATIYLTNEATGETVQIAGTFASGDVITLDRDTFITKRNGVEEVGLADMRIPGLLGDQDNDITLTLTEDSVATVSALSVTFTPRRF